MMTTKHPNAHGLRSSRGFSLIELMIAIVVGGIVLMGIFAFGSIQQTTAAMHRRLAACGNQQRL